MQLNNEHHLEASRAKVWEALNDLETLKASIPGCEQMERIDERTLRAVVKSRVGPVSARFTGTVAFSDIEPMCGYTITFKGEGGMAGFASGNARVDLSDDGDGTLLRYESKAQVGGKLAQIGSRLIDSVASKTASEFFQRFAAVVSQDQAKAD
ncbi:MAG: carbon monoxide dehydrogenase subunit G [Burkholderiales bacterium]|nr:carbon monoxide dehydrogenase subunit G [Burkholderiales bacterium]